MKWALAPRLMLLANSASLTHLTRAFLSTTIQRSSQITPLSSRITANLLRSKQTAAEAALNLNIFNAQLSSRANFNFFRIRRTNGMQTKPSLQEQLLTNNQKSQLSNQNRSNLSNAGKHEASTPAEQQQVKLSIFKRFKEAYKQHGKILIWTHVFACCGWIVGLFFLSKG
jgi:hypothetical protein